MEINHWGDTILPVVAQANIVEGRFVVLTSNSASRNFGSQTDQAGVRVPATGTEAARARYCVTFEQDNRSLPIYQPHPSFGFALREGFDQDANAPFDATVFLTRPGVQEGRTIPSGSGCLAFGEGVYTLPSGHYVYASDIEVPGTQLAVSNVSDHGADAGKPRVSATNPVAEVVRYEASTGRLMLKILH